MKKLLWLTNVLLAISLIGWPLGILLLAFMFEGPKAFENIILIFIGLSILTYPIPVLYSVTYVLSNKNNKSIIDLFYRTLIGLSPLVTIFILNIFLDVFCNGNSTCE